MNVRNKLDEYYEYRDKQKSLEKTSRNSPSRNGTGIATLVNNHMKTINSGILYKNNSTEKKVNVAKSQQLNSNGNGYGSGSGKPNQDLKLSQNINQNFKTNESEYNESLEKDSKIVSKVDLKNVKNN